MHISQLLISFTLMHNTYRASFFLYTVYHSLPVTAAAACACWGRWRQGGRRSVFHSFVNRLVVNLGQATSATYLPAVTQLGLKLAVPAFLEERSVRRRCNIQCVQWRTAKRQDKMQVNVSDLTGHSQDKLSTSCHCIRMSTCCCQNTVSSRCICVTFRPQCMAH